MTDGRIFLAIVALICIGSFFVGLRFTRFSEERVNKMQIELPAWLARGRTPVATVHLFGRIQMIAAPIFFLFFAALCFGLLGPVEGITPIKF